MSKLYSVPLSCSVAAFAAFEVEANSAEEAAEKVRRDIEENGWLSMAWQDTDWTTDWESAEGLCVDAGTREIV